MSDSPVNVTLTLSEDEVRVVAQALEDYRLEVSDWIDENDRSVEEFEIAGTLLIQLGRGPLDWADMDAQPVPDPDDDEDGP